MPYILAIETATKNCSAALFKDADLIACKEEGGAYNHAEKLTVFIRDLLNEAGVGAKELSAVATGGGPGSYTGLRIGTSTTKGICYALNLPLISISTLETMAAGAKNYLEKVGKITPATLLCPMIDARRMEVYSAIYDPNLNEIKPTSADIIEDATIYSKYGAGKICYYFGDGATKCKTVFETNQEMHYLEIPGLTPSARFMGQAAFAKLAIRQFEDLAYFEPFYLKNFMATKPKPLL